MPKLEAGQHRFTQVDVMDGPGAGGAHHAYRVTMAEEKRVNGHPVPIYATIDFQKGPVKENGINGIFMEDLLQICRHRLQCFQAGAFACRENEMALAKIEEALHWLNHRTADRQTRGVEGTNQQ